MNNFNETIPEFKLTPILKGMSEKTLEMLSYQREESLDGDCFDDDFFEKEILPGIFKSFGVSPDDEVSHITTGSLRPATDASTALDASIGVLTKHPRKQKKEVRNC